MDIIAWIVLGLTAGAIAKAIYPGHQSGGILGTMFIYYAITRRGASY